MSLPTVAEVRSRIEKISDLPQKRLFQTVHLFGLRIGEACGYKHKADKKTQNTGMFLWATKETWQPREEDFEEIALLKMLMARNYGKILTDCEVFQLQEPAFVLSIITEKREGYNRKVAVPLNAEYEPWANDVCKYMQERQIKGPLPHLKRLNIVQSKLKGSPVSLMETVQSQPAKTILEEYEPVFPFTRQEAYAVAIEVFHGLTYPITQYKKSVGKTVDAEGRGKNVYALVPEHQKKFSDHAGRHLRATELKSTYRIKGEALNNFMGWARERGSEASAMQDRYVLEPWREAGYFPRLMRIRR